MSDKSALPLGVRYNNPNAVEYQLFPEDFFSGSDITVYFGDIFVSDISKISFTLEEKLNPIFSYATHTWDAIARGTRHVEGYFTIPFREAGYLDVILGHLGKLGNAKPHIAYQMAGKEPPEWSADGKLTIEELLDKLHGEYGDSIPEIIPRNDIFDGKYPLTPGQVGPEIAELKRLLQLLYPGEDIYDSNNRLATYIRNNHGGFNMDSIAKYTATLAQNPHDGEHGSPRGNVNPLQERLAEINNRRVASDGKLGHVTTRNVLVFAELFRTRDADFIKNNSPRTLLSSLSQSSGNTHAPVLAKAPVNTIADLAGFDPPDLGEPRYASNIYRTVKRMQTQLGAVPNGIVDEDTIKKLYDATGEDWATNRGENDYIKKMRTQERFAGFEREVWGRDFSHDRKHKFKTYFYFDRNQVKGEDWQEKLKETGIDIYITYGPAEERNEQVGVLTDQLPFPTTVKAIRNVQFQSTGQTIQADGRPIEEIYTFIAKDLD